MNVKEEIVHYGGLNRVAAVPWLTILTELLPLLINLCPKKFESATAYEAAHDTEYRQIRRHGQKDRCPVGVRLLLKRHGVKGKPLQDEAWTRIVAASSGYTLVELSAD